jgi:hypothetical protein
VNAKFRRDTALGWDLPQLHPLYFEALLGQDGEFTFTIADLLGNDPGGAAKVDVGSQFFFGTTWRFAVLAGSASLAHWPGAGICYFAPDIRSSLPSWLDRQRATAFLKERGHHRAAGPRKTVLRVRRRTATESTRVAAMAAFAKSWRRESLAPAHEAVRGRASRVLGPVSTAPGLPAIALRF